jgi:DNA-binding PadR family transcriptional regulator
MTSLLKFGSREGQERSLLALYLLHSLSKSPKSGYDLIAEIQKKTGGLWVPSKGTLYPVLHQLEEEGLIAAVPAGNDSGGRTKTTYAVTEGGKEALATVKERGREGQKKMACCRKLLFDVFGGKKAAEHSLLVEIHDAFERLPPESSDRAVRVLEQCLHDLKRIGLE